MASATTSVESISGPPDSDTPTVPSAGATTPASFAELFAVTSPEVVAGILTDVFVGSAAAFVLFRHGTLVVFDSLPEGVAQRALDIIAAEGPVIPGTPFGDFGTYELRPGQGILVTGHYPRMFTYVSPKQLPDPPPPMMAIGIYGRTMRHLDSEETEIVHVATLIPAMKH
jgi:hypothetical protein